MSKTWGRRVGKEGALAAAWFLLWAMTGGAVDVRAQDGSGAVDQVVLHGPGAPEVRAVEEAFAQTMADRDFEAFLGFVSVEAVFFAGDRPLRGIEAVEEAWRPFFQGRQAPFSWTPDIVQVLESGDLAFSSGPVLDAAGEPVGRFNSVWRKESDGRWRVVFDRGS